MASQREDHLLICYYGDDFTGSTDSLEALTNHGVRTILFLEVPDPELLKERFSGIQGFGIAGVSRSMDPFQMEEELTPIFEQIQTLHTPIIHYKTCSTFDSSPQTGSIGKVIEIGRNLFANQRCVPLLVGAPILKRYTVFGNHFATVGNDTIRLDRHPTMMKHPVTPMREADLRLHLRQQADLKIALMDLFALEEEVFASQKKYESFLSGNNEVILFDVLSDANLERAGQLIWEESLHGGQQFVVGSSGVEYALAKYWRSAGIIGEPEVQEHAAGPVDQLLVVSGSCSPVTQQQISWALEHGFTGIKVSTYELLLHPNQVKQNVLDQAKKELGQGKNLLIYTAYGSDDPDIEKTKKLLISKGLQPSATGALIGQQLGEFVKELVLASGLKRVVIAGGDTSGYATKELGVYGLEMIKPLSPGAPLCRCYSDHPTFDGLEIVLKGGQVGPADFFARVQLG